MKHSKILFALVAVLTAAHSSVSAATGWPSTARPTLSAKVTYEPFDGGEMEHLTLEGGGVLFKTGNDINLRQKNPDWRYSILFENSRYPGSRVGLALFNRTEFLTSIESSAWETYLASLSYTYPVGLEIISDQGPAETTNGFPIMGMPYRELTYSYRVDATKAPIVRREYFIMMKDGLMVASAEATESYFQAVSGSMRSLLVGMDRVK